VIKPLKEDANRDSQARKLKVIIHFVQNGQHLKGCGGVAFYRF
jgi:hypothetical protein